MVARRVVLAWFVSFGIGRTCFVLLPFLRRYVCLGPLREDMNEIWEISRIW